eukprot:scaffold4079_cov250-Pinguiococcus_pyrenoidosus.AAC.2
MSAICQRYVCNLPKRKGSGAHRTSCPTAPDCFMILRTLAELENVSDTTDEQKPMKAFRMIRSLPGGGKARCRSRMLCVKNQGK